MSLAKHIQTITHNAINVKQLLLTQRKAALHFNFAQICAKPLFSETESTAIHFRTQKPKKIRIY